MPCVVTLTCNLGTWEARIFWVQFCILSSRPTWATESDLISKDQNLPGVVIHIFNSCTQEAETEIADLCEFKAAWSTNGFPGQKGSHSENLSLQKKLNNTSMIFPPAFSKPQFKPQVGGTVMWTLFTLKTRSPELGIWLSGRAVALRLAFYFLRQGFMYTGMALSSVQLKRTLNPYSSETTVNTTTSVYSVLSMDPGFVLARHSPSWSTHLTLHWFL